jgi:hypothetical protein
MIHSRAVALSVAVLQSNYIPWKGYFDIIHDVDLFVFYDDVQYTKNDWRNRNRIKTPRGARWLTVPVGQTIHRRICEVALPSSTEWTAAHWRQFEMHYGSAPYFDRYAAPLREIYTAGWSTLSALNQRLIETIARDFLGIATRFADSRRYAPSGKAQDRLLDLLGEVGATRYLSGPSARQYIDPAGFATRGVELVWKDYSGYPEYPQFHPPFDHRVTVLDLLFHVGPDAPRYVWGWRAAAPVSTEPAPG